MQKRILTNLNIDTKIFFIMLFFLFLLGAPLTKVELTLSSIPLGLSVGFLIGFIYFYGIGRLEIRKRKRYKEVKDSLLSKRMSGMIKGYYFVCAAVLFIGWWRIIVEEYSPRAVIIMFMAMGTLVTFSFFSAVGRLNVYKKDVRDSDKEKKVKS